MRILLLEDDRRLGPLVERALRGDGHEVSLHTDGIEALTAARAERYDVLVLDRRVPRLDGLSVLSALRAAGDATPTLLLTALAELDERIAGLDAGADDYLAKPFETAELLARVRSLGRRAPIAAQASPGLRVGSLELDEIRHVARVGAAEAELSAREFALLAFLMRHAGETHTRERILDEVWGGSGENFGNVVDLYISYLRRKLAELPGAPAIRTVRGHGYRLDR